MLTHPEFLAVKFGDWLTAAALHPDIDFPADGNVAELIAIWMHDGGATVAGSLEALMRAVVLIIASACRGELGYEVDGSYRPVAVPLGDASWWMLTHIEFDAARSLGSSAKAG